MHEQVTVSSKGQVVIPAGIRKSLKVKAGTKLTVYEDDGQIILESVRNLLRRLKGSLPKTKPSALEYLLAERRKDRY